MTYMQKAHTPVSSGPAVGRRSNVPTVRSALAILLPLAFLQGALYALFLPPWGLIDEAQHLHYIQVIAEEQALPVAGELYLSDEIIESHFATRRWQTFHWTPPPATEAEMMGLEGYSYEAYQPPLFYLLLTPLYWVVPGDMLVKVYALRLAVVLLSLVSIWAIYRTAAFLFPKLAFWAALFLIVIPERAIATSRINNDVLLEVMAALFFLVLTHTALTTLTPRRAFLLGVLLGLAAWVKISGALLAVPLLLLLWQHRHEANYWRSAAWALVALPLGAALALRNLSLYGDFTGFHAFEQLQRLAPVDTSLRAISSTLVALFNHFWLVWWKGSEIGGNGVLTLFYWLMALAVVASWGRLWLHFWQRRHVKQDRARSLALLYAVAVLVFATAVMGSYYQGMVPVVQGRFLLPVVLPYVLLVVWGLWLYRRAKIILALIIVLAAMGLLSLFGNLIPYYYYWSDVVAGTLPVEPRNLWQGLSMVYQRALFDKPSFLAPVLWLLPVCYAVALLYTLSIGWQIIAPPRHRFSPGNRQAASSEPMQNRSA
jgi:hypothetical protein